ncbi:MAG: hypothetical protein H0W72_08585 [Planctomycetes bacterium]|nr:hypothetical protein [Planctomycetota bacterium]
MHIASSSALAQRVLLAWLFAALGAFLASADAAPAIGVPVSYTLPTDGPLPRTWRVTLAIVEAKNPDWIIGQFACGVARTVTAENKGTFTEIWDGLDDNYMPVPPGTYGVKGICMPAEKWPVDDAWHSIVPRYATEATAFQRPTTPWKVPEPFGGDPVGAPLMDVTVSEHGIAVFYYGYLENGTNNPMIDLKKPLGFEQVLRAFNSGGAGGGHATATDGETVWSHSADGGPHFLYRADSRPFGSDVGAHRRDIHLPDGPVTDMAVWCEKGGPARRVFAAQRDHSLKPDSAPAKGPAGQVSVQDGADGKELGSIAVETPIGIAVRGDVLYALHGKAGGWAVSTVALVGGIPQGDWKRQFDLAKDVAPAGFAVDRSLRCYVSDAKTNRVLQYDPKGKVLRSLGRLTAQKSGSYDRETFMSPAQLATWTAPDGGERILVVEMAGPNRVSEWSADGTLVREFLTMQTHANGGWTVDPDNANHVYITGHQHWLTRFLVDPAKQTWTVDAVWPLDPAHSGLGVPFFIRRNGIAYLATAKDYKIFRQAGDRWVLSAGIFRAQVEGKTRHTTWHDADADGVVEASESTPLEVPPGVMRYHGEQWLEDLSLLAIVQNGKDIKRLAPESFDAHGNPVFGAWKTVLTDPVLVARAAGKADAIHGGNELGDSFDSDWAMADGSVEEGFYVHARSGSRGANFGNQHKVSRYVPDGKGGYTQKWRTGRVSLHGTAMPGEIISALHMRKPINGLLSIIDNTRCGVVLYTEDGLYVDTLFPDGRAFSPQIAGMYSLPGEFFSGIVIPNKVDGRIYLGFGKNTPQLFVAEGWTLKDNPVRRLTDLPKTVRILAAQIAQPPEIALSLRGGAGAARFADIAPAIGGAVLDGSLAGWEACRPIRFQADKDRTVEVRLLYDPEKIYLRWNVRLGAPFKAQPLAPVERIFTHDRLADTLSFYIQGDPQAKAELEKDGRPGDARIVFGLFDDQGTVKPVALGMYPRWAKGGKAQQYSTAAGGKAAFEHVAALVDLNMAYRLDDDKAGYVLVAAIPRTALPGLPVMHDQLHTLVNFEATFAGHLKTWWANSDGSASTETYDEPTEARLYQGSWAPMRFVGLGEGVLLRNWQILGPFGGPGAEKFQADLGGHEKDAGHAFCRAAAYPPDDGTVDLAQVFTGDAIKGYWGAPGDLRWRAASPADLDNRVVFGEAAQVWYAATWINVPKDTEVQLLLHGHHQTTIAWFLNDQEFHRGESGDGKENPALSKTVTLKAGWNEVRLRGYCVGYPPFRAGVVVKADPATLWKLRLSGTPPAR